jgi:hypothetical protein
MVLKAVREAILGVNKFTEPREIYNCYNYDWLTGVQKDMSENEITSKINSLDYWTKEKYKR